MPRTAVRQLQHEALQMLAQLDQVHAQLAMLQAGLTAAGDCTAAANERAAVAEERAAAAEAAAESCEQAKAHVQLEDVQPEVLELQARVAELGAAREELDTLEHRHEQCLPLLTALAQEKRPRTNTPRTKDCFCVARQALESFMVERIEEWHVFQALVESSEADYKELLQLREARRTHCQRGFLMRCKQMQQSTLAGNI